MTRRGLPFLLAILVSTAAFALEFGPPVRVADTSRTAIAPFTVRSIVADGQGGAVAFGRLSKSGTNRVDIIAIPVQPNGTPQWERAFTIAVNAAANSAVAAAKIPSGYLVTFRDVEGNGYVVPLNNDLTVGAAPLLLPQEEPYPLACNGAICAGVSTDSLLLLESSNRVLGRTSITGASRVAAISGGFAVSAITTSQSAEVRFVNLEGAVTATAQLPWTSGHYFFGPAVAPHPLGAVAFWGIDNAIRAAVVRADGAVVSTATLTSGTAGIGELAVAANNGQYALVFINYTSYILCTCPPNSEVRVARVSESLQLLGQPATLSDSSSGGPQVTSSATNFVAAWMPAFFETGSRVTVIPAAGTTVASNSAPLALGPATQQGAGVAASADRRLAVWSVPPSLGASRLQAARIDANGTRLDAAPLGLSQQVSAAVASDGRDFMVNTGSELIAVDGDDGTSRLLTNAMQSVPLIASDGTGYLLPIYEQSEGYLLRRVTPTGVALWARRLNFYPYGIAAIPGRAIAAGSQGPSVGYQIFDTAGNQIAFGTINIPHTAFNLRELVSNGRDQFLLVIRDVNNLYAVRIGANGGVLDPAPVPLGPFGNSTVVAAAPLGGHWLIASDQQAIEFPSRASHLLPDGEKVVDLAGASGGRAVLLSSRTAVVDGQPVSVVMMREVTNTGGIPPRRRGANR